MAAMGRATLHTSQVRIDFLPTSSPQSGVRGMACSEVSQVVGTVGAMPSARYIRAYTERVN